MGAKEMVNSYKLVGTEDVVNPVYWKDRLDKVRTHKLSLHRSVFVCPDIRWRFIEETHRTIIIKLIKPTDSIIDIGCGYGRLLNLMPPTWRGCYLGLDICEEFLSMARETHKGMSFLHYDILNPKFELPYRLADWCVLASFKYMIIRNLGDEAWKVAEANISKLCRYALYLEYDENDLGTIVRYDQP
jgi:SAM-dependent methyltransferase